MKPATPEGAPPELDTTAELRMVELNLPPAGTPIHDKFFEQAKLPANELGRTEWRPDPHFTIETEAEKRFVIGVAEKILARTRHVVPRVTYRLNGWTPAARRMKDV